MPEVLTIAEITNQHKDEWVLIGDPQTNATMEIQSGRVLFHSPDRDRVYDEAIRLKPKRFAFIYTSEKLYAGEIVLLSVG